MKHQLTVSGLVMGAALLTACGGPGSKAAQEPLTITVTGKCSDPQGFRLHMTGFTPNRRYQTEVNYPDGTPYTYLQNFGLGDADANGQPSNWTWDCTHGINDLPDPEGMYFLKVTDVTTKRSAVTFFIVNQNK